jgi:hypothetical protein
MGRAVGEIPADASAFWYRQAPHNLDVHAVWAPGDDAAANRAWASSTRQAVRHASAGGGYVNFLGAGERAAPGREPTGSAPPTAGTTPG